ncbi:MAG TPA: hypothetical protein VIN08_21610 [Ohtaekwangia sp.]|uniref:hypothetical protein n=1 Tax=Ohtaekwangia sp. TaxID=2066019 RepID=UPI002F91F046
MKELWFRFINAIAKNKYGKSTPGVNPEFNNWVRKGIEVLGDVNNHKENNRLVDDFVAMGIPEEDAADIVIFLPVSFCRKLLSEVKWLPEYIDMLQDGTQIRKSYSQNLRYRMIERETKMYFNNNAEKEVILNIAGRSAEFRLINKLLLENAEANLKDIRLTETVFIR